MNRLMAKYLTMNRTFDITKAKERLGYRPEVSVEEGIRSAVRAYMTVEAEHGYKKE
ncbi:sterol-4-alpha-carboxylate 3-dehydrogenase [Paraphaeosphaeria sporulosa]